MQIPVTRREARRDESSATDESAERARCQTRRTDGGVESDWASEQRAKPGSRVECSRLWLGARPQLPAARRRAEREAAG